MGVALFPLIQAQDSDCRSCDGKSAKKRQKHGKKCKNPSYKIAMFFDADNPTALSYYDYNSTADLSDTVQQYQASAISLSLTGGIDFLNAKFYNRLTTTGSRTSLHCTSSKYPAFEILQTKKASCSTLSTSERKKSDTYCADPPEL